MKIMMIAFVGFFLQVAGAETAKGPLMEAAPIIEAAAKMANTGLIEIKDISKFEKMMVSAADKKFLKSISYKPMLPKGYTAVPMIDRLMIVKGKRMVSGIQIVSMEPFVIKLANGKKWTIDSKNITGSFKVGRLDSSSSEYVGLIQSLLFSTANADEDSDAIDKKVAFICQLMKVSFANRFPDKEGLYDRISPSISKAMKALDFDGDVRCAGRFADLVVRKGNLSTHVTHDGSAAYCSKDVPNHKIFHSNEYQISSEFQDAVNNNCIESDPQQTSDDLTQQREKLLSLMGSEFALKNSIPNLPGRVEVDGEKCSIHFDEKPPYPLETLAKLRDDIGQFCENNSMAAKANELESEIKDRASFMQSLHDNSTGIANISAQLADCCADNNCRLKASDVGIKLLPDPETTK